MQIEDRNRHLPPELSLAGKAAEVAGDTACSQALRALVVDLVWVLDSQAFAAAEAVFACCSKSRCHAFVAARKAGRTKATGHCARTQARRTRCRHTDSRQHPAEEVAVVASVAGTVAAVAVALGTVRH